MTRQSDGHSGFPERTFSFQLASDEARLARGAQSEAMSDLTLSPAGRANWFVYGSLVVGVVVYELSGGEAGEPTSGLLMGVTFAIGILLWLATWSWRLWTGRGSFVIDTPTTVHVTESGFAVEARGLSARRSWEKLKAIKETAAFFVLVLHAEKVVVLPKRAMPVDVVERFQALRHWKDAEISRKFGAWARRFPF